MNILWVISVLFQASSCFTVSHLSWKQFKRLDLLSSNIDLLTSNVEFGTLVTLPRLHTNHCSWSVAALHCSDVKALFAKTEALKKVLFGCIGCVTSNGIVRY